MNNLLAQTFIRDIYIMTLGVGPLLVVAHTLQTSLAIGAVFFFASIFICLTVSIVRNLVPMELRVTVIVLVTAMVLALIYIFMQLWFYESGLKLGIYVPLIAMNCLVLAQAEEYALRNDVAQSLCLGLVTGMEVLLLMIVIGSIREYSGLSVIKQAPGAFLLLAFVLAGTQWIAARARQPVSASS